MAYLPLANLTHHKLRSALSALGIGIGICMLIALSGLARGSLFEIAERWESVDADLIVFPRGWGDNATDKSGSGLSDRYADVILREHGDLVQRVVPVFTWPMELAGQDQMVAGVDREDFPVVSGGRELSAGRLFDPGGRFSEWIERKLLTGGGDDGDEPLEITTGQLAKADRNAFEIVIDSRLAAAGDYRVGQTVTTAGHDWEIVGIVPAGAMTRVMMPRRTAQFLFGSGQITQSTLMFVQLREGVDKGPAARTIAETIHQDVVPLSRYRAMLLEKFGIMFRYVDAVNAIALVIAFLFIMVTLYTMILQRTREIAILKASGASSAFIVRQVLAESLILTGAGTAAGIALSFLAGWAIETIDPLLTVQITWRWIAMAAGAAAVGAIVAGLYPAWRATRVDVVKALTLE
ncbi:MAG: ABC transporter permease [Phycisphaerae bacterium]